MSSDPYGDWRDSECAGFIQNIIEHPETRDTTRLIFADWLEERGDLERANEFREPNGYWKDLANGLVSWDCCPGQRKYGVGGFGLPMHWVGWNWEFPSAEWLKSQSCLRLVKAWVRNYVIHRRGSGKDERWYSDYQWALDVARANGLIR